MKTSITSKLNTGGTGIDTGKNFGLSSSTLKIIACIIMAIDHIGMGIFTDIEILRIIGRLAFPIFAFFIAEGCRYTRNMARHFLTIAIFGICCQAVYVVFMHDWFFNILITFTLSIALIFILQWVAKVFRSDANYFLKAACLSVMIVAISATFLFADNFEVDYGFTGVMIPVVLSIPYTFSSNPAQSKNQKYFIFQLIALSIMLIMLSFRYGKISIELYSLLSIPILMLYNGNVGMKKMKYAFYIFYPLHLAIIQIIAMLIK